MRIINISVTPRPTIGKITIGRRGENLAAQVVFDISYLRQTYGDGVAVLLFKRYGDDAAYPVTAEQDGDSLIWTVSDIDTAIRGLGQCELYWYVDELLAKSCIWSVFIDSDIGDTTTPPPSGYESWVDTLTDLGAETLQNAQDAAASAADAATYAGTARTAERLAHGYQLETEAAKLAAEAAKGAAQTAQGKAEDAQAAAELAQGKAEDAQGKAETAQASAESAASAAETARALAYAAQVSAETAMSNAEWEKILAGRAKDAAEAAQAAAETAQGKAEDAQEAAEAAQIAAETAQTAAETAQTEAEAAQSSASASATSASTSASTATTKAGEAAASAAAASAAQTAAETAQGKAEDAQEAAEEVLESIPQDYSDLSADVGELKSAIGVDLYIHGTDTDAFQWLPGYRVNSTRKDYTTSNVSKYAGLYKNSSKEYLIVYPGSRITANTGYTMDYAVTSENHSTSYEGQRGISAGTTITVKNKGVLILSVTDGINDVTTVEEAKALAKAGLTIDLFLSTEAETKVDKDQGSANAGKLLGVGNNGIVVPVPATDATLQQSGVPADAKTVGDNLLLSMDTGSIVFKIGGFNATGTTNDTLTTQVRTKKPVKVGPYGGSIGCDAGYEIRVFNYSQATFSGDYLISKTNFTSDTVELIPNTYVGFSIRNTTPAEQSDVSNSEHFVINIPEQTVAEAVEKLINGDISSYNHGPFDLYKERFSEWYSGLQDDYTGFSRTSKYADVIAAFDALMALDTQYISKTTLGTASGTDSGGNAYTMYEYVFKPKNYTSTLNARKVPKIYMDGSIHGFEKCSTYGLYYFLKDLVENWNKNQSLAAIRQSVEIHVIPVSNPYGFDNIIYKNGNDVNINRNFDHNGEWIVVPDGSDQNGSAAFDQPESAIIRDWLLADESNILCYLNLHTNGQWNVSSYGEMNANMPSSDRYDDYYNRIFRAITNHIEEQTIRWPSMYESIRPGENSFCGKIQASVTEASTKGTASQWANTMQRIVAMTFEGFNGININDTQIVDVFGTQAQKMNSENIGNIVIQMLREYAD